MQQLGSKQGKNEPFGQLLRQCHRLILLGQRPIWANASAQSSLDEETLLN
jgi:hypothetical protein